MSDVLDQPTVEIPVNGHVGDETGSLMAALRAKREALAEDKRLELDIPGYSGLLAARYKPVGWEEITKISDRVQNSKDPRADVLGAADLLIACCEEMLTRIDGEYVPLHLAPGLELDSAVAYDPQLAAAFGFEAEKARDVVLEVFRNDFAVIDQHRQLLAWLRDSSAEVDQDF